MTAQHLAAGLLCVVGVFTFTGILCWTLAREDEAFEEALRNTACAPPRDPVETIVPARRSPTETETTEIRPLQTLR